MVNKHTDFLPGITLRYTWENKKALFKSIGARSLKDFVLYIQENDFTDELLEKIITYGLLGGHNKITEKEIPAKISEYYDQYGNLGMLTLALQALCDGGIIEQKVIDQAKALIENNNNDGKAEVKGLDTGEATGKAPK